MPEDLPHTPISHREIGGEAGIRTLGTAFRPYNGLANRRLQPLGHLTAARNLSIRQASSYGNATEVQIVPEIVPAISQNPPRNARDRASGALTARQRFFSPTTMPATGWRTPLYSHEPASTPLATRALKIRGARRTGARTGLWQAPGLRNRSLVPEHYRVPVNPRLTTASRSARRLSSHVPVSVPVAVHFSKHIEATAIRPTPHLSGSWNTLRGDRDTPYPHISYRTRR